MIVIKERRYKSNNKIKRTKVTTTTINSSDVNGVHHREARKDGRRAFVLCGTNKITGSITSSSLESTNRHSSSICSKHHKQIRIVKKMK